MLRCGFKKSVGHRLIREPWRNNKLVVPIWTLRVPSEAVQACFVRGAVALAQPRQLVRRRARSLDQASGFACLGARTAASEVSRPFDHSLTRGQRVCLGATKLRQHLLPNTATLSPMHPLIKAHRDELIALAHRRGMTALRVFGSMRRGDARDDSDVDLLVTLAPGISALALGGLLMDVQALLGRRVDVVTEASLHPALRERVLAEAELL